MGRTAGLPRSEWRSSANGTEVTRPLVAAVILVIVAGALAACGSSSTIPTTTSATSPTSTIPIPAGWKTYTYGAAAISVPANWVVRHNTNCPDGQAVGTLLLGIPKVLENCPFLPASLTYVAVSTPSTTSSSSASPGEKPTIVNGVPVYPGFGSPSSVEWSVPALGLQVYGTGTGVEAVLNTLRRAS